MPAWNATSVSHREIRDHHHSQVGGFFVVLVLSLFLVWEMFFVWAWEWDRELSFSLVNQFLTEWADSRGCNSGAECLLRTIRLSSLSSYLQEVAGSIPSFSISHFFYCWCATFFGRSLISQSRVYSGRFPPCQNCCPFSRHPSSPFVSSIVNTFYVVGGTFAADCCITAITWTWNSLVGGVGISTHTKWNTTVFVISWNLRLG